MADNELYHYGILGQKWGKRNYQYEDGSLTPEGRVHYGVGPARTARQIDKAAKTAYRLNQFYGSYRQLPSTYQVGAAMRPVHAEFTKEDLNRIKELSEVMGDKELAIREAAHSNLDSALRDPSFQKYIDKKATKSYEETGGKYDWDSYLDTAIYDSFLDPTDRAKFFPEADKAAKDYTKANKEYTAILEKKAHQILADYSDQPVKTLPYTTYSKVLVDHLARQSRTDQVGYLEGEAILKDMVSELYFADYFPAGYPYNKHRE